MVEEEFNHMESKNSKDFFKMLILNKFKSAFEKNKDIYYIPNFNSDVEITSLLKIKNLLKEEYNFNMLCFYEEFQESEILSEILSNLNKFDYNQILKDY